MTQHLLIDFYTELSSTFSKENETGFTSLIRLNPLHEVYKGHFPQVPVAPGVVLVQIVKEILEEKLQVKLRLTEGDNIKFLALINPTENNEFHLDFSLKRAEEMLEVNAGYTNNGKSFSKFKGKFKVIS